MGQEWESMTWPIGNGNRVFFCSLLPPLSNQGGAVTTRENAIKLNEWRRGGRMDAA